MAFSDILGHDRQIDVLRRAIKADRVPHAFLFFGDEGIGKRKTAFEFAKAMNCEGADGGGLFGDLEPPDGGCGNCRACRSIDAGSHPNVSIMQLMENPDTGKMRQEIVISQVQEARGYLSLKPVGDGSKVLIVDGAHLMNVSAANAFLKTLEEPPERTHIVLITSKPGMLLETIISRTRAIGFQPLSDETVKSALVEMRGMKEDDAGLVARMSMGRLGTALEADPKQLRKDRKQFLDTLGKVTQEGYAALLAQAEKVAKDTERFRSFIYQGTMFFRDITVVWMSGDYGLAYNSDIQDELAGWSKRVGPDGSGTAVRLLERAAYSLEKTYNNRMAAEELFIGIREDAFGTAARV